MVDFITSGACTTNKLLTLIRDQSIIETCGMDNQQETNQTILKTT